MTNLINTKVKLNNGTMMPIFGLGVFQVPSESTKDVVAQGIENGYRLIDTAQIYGNEAETGLGIKEGLEKTGSKREDLFVTSKVWNNHLTYEETLDAFEDSRSKLGLDYLDLYLIHWPGNDAFKESWRALEDLYEAGKIKAIGVSNFNVEHLEELSKYARITPVLNQIELHPKLSQKDLRAYHMEKGILTQAWSPLMQGQLFDNPLILELASKYGKSAAQIILAWNMQEGNLLITKSLNPERLKSNADIFDIEFTEDDMNRLNELNEDVRVGPDPKTFDFA